MGSIFKRFGVILAERHAGKNHTFKRVIAGLHMRTAHEHDQYLQYLSMPVLIELATLSLNRKIS